MKFLRGSYVVPFWACYFLVRDCSTVPNKELHRRVWVSAVEGPFRGWGFRVKGSESWFLRSWDIGWLTRQKKSIIFKLNL